tara:strand:+ start:429 stop:827 length:399 start_codon:yes stop_codon:yes gene_type:complete
MKIAIIGSREYQSKNKIKDFIWQAKNKYGDKLQIISGGAKYGADKYAKNFSLEMAVDYGEYPPVHENHNMYCVQPSFVFNKPYNVGNYHLRNMKIVDNSDVVVAFCKGKLTNGTRSAINYCIKKEKKFIIID